ncbi:hypothetical protein BT96DRAFT_1025178 [Gymnopus androsaceus JB14]|uniref:Uncharacterized protein n=1 Tax=Gymnopus androsaceus JB14 TaxID=1447944 RepID=A0A6A4GTR8_9AGAR|nr:hypothetical protein BT96DRAFT_1025178 [Gymnopus androsaceus JB14]
MSESILPEEILHSVVESLAYNAEFVERNLFRFHWKNATNELFSFSVACHQFRRISLPFLFSYIEINGDKHLEMFKDQCILNASFAESIKSLSVSFPSSWENTSHTTTNMMKHLLRYLKHLSQLDVNFRIDMSLLVDLNRHSLETVVEKILLATATIDDGVNGRHLKGHLACGMQLRSFVIRQDLMDNSSGMQKFNGLNEIEVQLLSNMSFSWLPEFTRAHPLLKKISFKDSFDFLKSKHHTIPFIQPLCEALHKEGVYTAVRILDMTRNWEVTGLYLWDVGDRLVLPIVHSLFPRISTLTLERGCGRIGELITFLSPFSSLQVLTLRFCFQYLELGFSWLGNHPRLPADPFDTEAGMIQHISRIAREIPSIEAFYIEEQDSHRDSFWAFRGWIDARKDMTEVLTMIRQRQSVGDYMASISHKHSTIMFFI